MHNENLYSYQTDILAILTTRKIHIAFIKLYQYLKKRICRFFVNSKILILIKLLTKKTEIYYYI